MGWGIAFGYRFLNPLDKLALGVSDALSRTFLDIDVETGVENGKLMAYLAAHGEVLSKRFNDSRVTIHCRLPQKHLGRIREPQTIIRPHAKEFAPLVDEPPADSAMEDVA